MGVLVVGVFMELKECGRLHFQNCVRLTCKCSPAAYVKPGGIMVQFQHVMGYV